MQRPHLIATLKIPLQGPFSFSINQPQQLNKLTVYNRRLEPQKTQTPLRKRYLLAVPQTVNDGRTLLSLSTQLNSDCWRSNFPFSVITAISMVRAPVRAPSAQSQARLGTSGSDVRCLEIWVAKECAVRMERMVSSFHYPDNNYENYW